MVSAYHYQVSCETNCQIIPIFLNFRIFRSPSSRAERRRHTKGNGRLVLLAAQNKTDCAPLVVHPQCNEMIRHYCSLKLQPASHLTRDSASTTQITTYAYLDVRISTIRDRPFQYRCCLHFVTCSHKSGKEDVACESVSPTLQPLRRSLSAQTRSGCH